MVTTRTELEIRSGSNYGLSNWSENFWFRTLNVPDCPSPRKWAWQRTGRPRWELLVNEPLLLDMRWTPNLDLQENTWKKMSASSWKSLRHESQRVAWWHLLNISLQLHDGIMQCDAAMQYDVLMLYDIIKYSEYTISQLDGTRHTDP